MSQLKIKDGANWIPIPAGGIGVPSGGDSGEILVKSSSTDYATQWALPLSLKLLWTNPSPSSSFASQTISLDLSGYDFVMVVYQHWTNSDVNNSAFCRIGVYGRLESHDYSLAYRDYHPEATGVYFNTGILVTSYGNSSVQQNTSAVIPLRIYGIKGVQ